VISRRGVEEFGKAIQLDPNDFKGYLLRNSAYRGLVTFDERGNYFSGYIEPYQNFIAGYTKIIKLDPDYETTAKAYLTRARDYESIDQHQNAIKEYTKVTASPSSLRW
jgi:tetratricopeptide (TPR) repeat protein